MILWPEEPPSHSLTLAGTPPPPPPPSAPGGLLGRISVGRGEYLQRQRRLVEEGPGVRGRGLWSISCDLVEPLHLWGLGYLSSKMGVLSQPVSPLRVL